MFFKKYFEGTPPLNRVRKKKLMFCVINVVLCVCFLNERKSLNNVYERNTVLMFCKWYGCNAICVCIKSLNEIYHMKINFVIMFSIV